MDSNNFIINFACSKKQLINYKKNFSDRYNIIKKKINFFSNFFNENVSRNEKKISYATLNNWY